MQSSCIQNHKCKLQLKYKSCVLLFFNKALANTEWQILGLTCCLFSLQLNSVYPMVYAFINRTVPSLWLYFCRAKAIKHTHKTFGVSEKYTSLIFYPTENIMEKAKCFHPKQILCFRFFFFFCLLSSTSNEDAVSTDSKHILLQVSLSSGSKFLKSKAFYGKLNIRKREKNSMIKLK